MDIMFDIEFGSQVENNRIFTITIHNDKFIIKSDALL